MIYDISTIVWREMMILRRRIVPFLFTRMVSPLLYLVTFGLGLGKSIRMDTGNYLDFVISGIIALNSMMVAFSSVAPSICMSRILYMTFDEYRSAPISAAAYAWGHAVAATIRALLSSGIIMVIAFLFGANLHIDIRFIFVLVANSMLFAFIGIVAAMLVNSHEDLNMATTYLIMPMSFLCGTFFRVDNFPPLLKTVVEFLPLTPASSLLRAIGSGGQPDGFFAVMIMVYLSVAAVLAIWSIKHVRKG